MKIKTLADILTPAVVTFSPAAPLASVLEAMEQQRISSIVAVDADRRPLGVLTEHDVLALFASGASLVAASLADAMTAPAYCAPAGTDYREAYYRMAERQIRHLVAVDEAGVLVGIVSEADFLHHLGEEYLVEVKTVATAMDRDVVSLDGTASLGAALSLMAERKSDYVVVLAAGSREPVGVLTERDVVRLARAASDRAASLESLMTPLVHSIAPEAPVQQASLRMRQLAVRRLLVKSEQQGIVGVITRHDIVKALQGGYVEYLRETLSRLRRELADPELPLLDFHRHLLLGGVLDLIADGIYMVDTAGRFLDANERGCAALGLSHAELRQRMLWDVAVSVDGQEAWAAFQQNHFIQGMVLEDRHRRKDGSSFPVRVRLYASQSADRLVYLGVASDRSEEVALSESLRAGERFYRHVIDSTVDGFFMVDNQRRFTEVNDRLCELFGYPREEWLGRTPLDFITEDSREELIAQMRRMESTDHRRYQLLARRKDGSTFPILLNNTTHLDPCGAVIGSFGFVTDLSPIVAAQRAVTESERELRAILDDMQDTYYRVDLDGLVVRASPSAWQLLGYTAEELLGQRMADHYLEPGARAVFLQALQDNGGRLSGYEAPLRHRNGQTVWVSTSAHYVRDADGHVAGIEGVAHDITERRQAAARIDFLAHHDPLTELPNRLLFKDRCERAMAHGLRAGTRTALLFVDLDRFKAVNDSFGHPVGDALLRDAARRLDANVRDTDTVSRQGGDEFLVALTDIRDDEAIARIAEKILAALALPFMIEGKHEVMISASIGIALCPDDGKDFETLLRKSDIAMYHAKDAGRNAFRFYNERMNVDSHERMDLRQRIHRGLERGEFQLHYQPLIDLASGRIVGAEALLRWLCPERGMIAPAYFIPVAEESGLIVPLGEWVLHEACRELRRWHDGGRPELGMAVNLSAIQFRRGGLEDSLRAALDLTGIPAAALELELTESILLHEADQALAVIRRLKTMGVRLAIDDFGTGYSSLAYLKRLAVDKLKIDQSFVRDMAHDPDDAAIVRAVIQMAKSLNLAVLAEGVETALVADSLRLLECDLVQGYHFGRPVPAEEFRRLIGTQD